MTDLANRIRNLPLDAGWSQRSAAELLAREVEALEKQLEAASGEGTALIAENRGRTQNYWVSLAMRAYEPTADKLLYCTEHRRIVLTFDGEKACCLKARLDETSAYPGDIARFAKAFKKWIVRRPDGGCQVLLPLSELDATIASVLGATDEAGRAAWHPMTEVPSGSGWKIVTLVVQEGGRRIAMPVYYSAFADGPGTWEEDDGEGLFVRVAWMDLPPPLRGQAAAQEGGGA